MKLNNIIKYILSFCLLFIILFIISLFINKDNNIIKYKNIDKRNITLEDDNFYININYPYFKDNNKINKDIKTYIYEYANKFKSSKVKNKSLIINYEVNIDKDILNIFFNIDNSLNKNIIYKSFNYSLDNKEIIINPKIYEYIKNKYNNDIYRECLNINKEDISYKVSNNKEYYYFNYYLFNNIEYNPNIVIDNNKLEYEINNNDNIKYASFTFDDGPSKYTLDIMNSLKLYGYTATFFMIGEKMKSNIDIINTLINNNMEIGSHSYTHKNMNELSINKIDYEVNSTSIIFNEITNKNISLFRPPYGNANKKVKYNVPFPLITWSIDTEDWLYKNHERISNHIINNIKDGSIILMHDIYPETLEGVKTSLPILKDMGYKIVSVSELAHIKGVKLENNKVYSNF